MMIQHLQNDPWMTRKFSQNDRNSRKWSVLLNIQQTSTVFAKIDMTQHKKISLIQNPDPRAKKVGRKSDPPGSENLRIPGGRLGRGEWSGLDLTDTLLSEVQAGFRKGYSMGDQVFNLKCLIDLTLEAKKETVL